MNTFRTLNTPMQVLAAVLGVALLGVVVFYLGKDSPQDTPRKDAPTIEVPVPIVPNTQKGAQYPTAKELEGIAGYINSPSADGGDTPFRIADWVGRRVILLQFWSANCTNCKRVQPYMNAWHDNYKEKGLLTIGVHTPITPEGRVYGVVSDAVRNERITYPVVVDSDFKTWDAYENDAWPHLYLIDTDGYVVYEHVGEDAYLETEMKIRELLMEHAQKRGNPLPILNMIPKESPAGEVTRDPSDPGYIMRGQ